ncbi:hypothetical protein M378DRAFT_76148 [Amanita muscaria Koide BX008]|uniref:DUF6589 domain-containing protein n=1 Tax=Amanita muscaria (strain Koide BX008) TaxID=946122 RepID=A0A0C2WVL9_AMAMK|nr:hypothetical protein M378DRAFT_76148 [Amanita muscaria Koide BX008]
MNILCNPSGQKGAFRAIDWVVEHHNYFLKKCIYGGKYSNYTKARIIQESCLIETYRRIRTDVEQMFLLDHKTNRHSLPDLKETLSKLAQYIEKERMNIYIKGRKARYMIPNAIAEGMDKMFGLSSKASSSELWVDLPDDNEVEEEDLEDTMDDNI